jgi:hypothetical protein
VLGPSRGLRYGTPVATAAGLNERSKTRAVLLAVAEEKVKNKNKKRRICFVNEQYDSLSELAERARIPKWPMTVLIVCIGCVLYLLIGE